MSDLSDLFALDPLHMSEQDLAKIVARMREAQAQFELGARAPVAERKKRSSAGENLLKELGLDK